MNEDADIEELLQQAASAIPQVTVAAVDKIHADIVRPTQTVDRRTYIAIGLYTLIASLLCVLTMVVMSVSWWVIAASFIGSVGLAFSSWFMIKSWV